MIDFEDRNLEKGTFLEWNKNQNRYNFQTLSMYVTYGFVQILQTENYIAKKIGTSYFGPTGIVNM